MKKSELQSILRSLEGYKIELTTEEYIKKEGNKTFSKKPNTTSTEEITIKEYDNIFSAIDFFKGLGGTETITKTYTIAGYIPTRLISTSPAKNKKVVRIFNIKR